MISNKTVGEKIFCVINYVILTLLAIIMLYPILYTLSASISEPQCVAAGEIVLMPKGFNLSAYREVLNDKMIWISYGNTFFYTIFGTIISMILTIFGGYALSKRRLRGRKIFNLLLVFTMWFHAGTIPTYLTIRDYGLLNTRTGILVSFAINTFYLILMRTFFESIPQEMEESAKIDGANDIQILFSIYIHLAKTAVVTISLFYFVSKWNAYFWAMILLRDEWKIPLQVLLKKLIINLTSAGLDAAANQDSVGAKVKETIIYSTIIVSIVPMVIIYPFIQKYFVSGVMVGAIKG